MSTRPSGRLISTTSAHGPSPSAPISTSLKTQATHPPSLRERARKYPTAVAPPISRRSPRHRLRATLPRSQRPARAHGASRLTPNFATVPLTVPSAYIHLTDREQGQRQLARLRADNAFPNHGGGRLAGIGILSKAHAARGIRCAHGSILRGRETRTHNAKTRLERRV